MDYIQKLIKTNIKRIQKRKSGQYSTIVGYYNVLLQYQLYLLFACIWQKREPELSIEEKKKYLSIMKRAALGTVLETIVDLEKKGDSVLGIGEDYKQLVKKLINIRNTEIGHGIAIPVVQEDSYKQIAEEYELYNSKIDNLKIPILSEECKIYYQVSDNETLEIDCNDYDYRKLSETLLKTMDFMPKELYYYFNNTSYRISPFFILKENSNIEKPFEIYCYQNFDMRTGRFDYKLYSELKDNTSCSETDKNYFLSFQEENNHTICKANGVICNRFKNNYDYYISTYPIDTYEQKVWKFIKEGKSNACLTIRGGGGIGKTALVHYVCNKYFFEPENVEEIQYVIFCSAKDREFKQVSGIVGRIVEIKEEFVVTNYKDIIRNIGWVLDDEAGIESQEDIDRVEQMLIDTSGLLLIIDDFETLSEEDKKKVVELSLKLDVSKHKMIITTRSQYMVGEEFYIEELDKTQTITFMKERFKKVCEEEEQRNEFNLLSDKKEIKNIIHEITRGLPLLAIQLVNVLIIEGVNENSLVKREDEEIEEFLLGRLYRYFKTDTSKILFLIILYFRDYGEKEISISSLEILYLFYCKTLGKNETDFQKDLEDLRKLNVILIETECIRFSNNISNRIIKNCQQEIEKNPGEKITAFDTALFKSIHDKGIKEGILNYIESNSMIINDVFIQMFVFENKLKYTNVQRLSILEKYINNNINNDKVIAGKREEAYKYFGKEMIEELFSKWDNECDFKNTGLNKDDANLMSIEKNETQVLLDEIIEDLKEKLSQIEDIIKEKGNISDRLFTERCSEMRNACISFFRSKLANALSLDLSNYFDKLAEIKNVVDNIINYEEFEVLKDYDQYITIEQTIKDSI